MIVLATSFDTPLFSFNGKEQTLLSFGASGHTNFFSRFS
jgi:hypothetical protein